MAVDAADVHVPDHPAEDVHIHLEDTRALGTIQRGTKEELVVVLEVVPYGPEENDRGRGDSPRRRLSESPGPSRQDPEEFDTGPPRSGRPESFRRLTP
jgi:hypothetical protein